MPKVNLKKLESVSKETDYIKNSVDISDLKDTIIKTESPWRNRLNSTMEVTRDRGQRRQQQEHESEHQGAQILERNRNRVPTVSDPRDLIPRRRRERG